MVRISRVVAWPGPKRFEGTDALQILGALAQSSRLEVFRLLIRYLPYGLAAGDIARLLVVPHNTLSTHLAALEQAGLVTSRRYGRSIIYAADRNRAMQLASFLLEDCCRVTGQTCEAMDKSGVGSPYPAKREGCISEKKYNVLVLCNGNSARSILAEAIFDREGAGRMRVFSAGRQPKREPNPYALALLKDLGYETIELRSKGWDDFTRSEAPHMDFIVTVCDSVAGPANQNWPGDPIVVHWGIPDPSTVQGTDAEKRTAFVETYRRLAARITSFVNLDIEELDDTTLRRKLRAIGFMDGATEKTLQGEAA